MTYTVKEGKVAQVEKITTFQSKNTKHKNPISPYDDNTFLFETHPTTTNLQAYSIMVSHFILNLPLGRLTKPVRTFRRKINLEPMYETHITHLIIDIDDVKSEFAKQKILDYFKDYKVILGESRSYNGFDNFNMKGILFTEEIDINETKLALSAIHHDLQEYCTIDESVCRKAALNAPILKSNVFLNNEDGIRYKFVKQTAADHIRDIKNEYLSSGKALSSEISLDDIQRLGQNIEAETMEKLCLKVFQSMGFEAIKNNPNDSISFKHPSEKKSPGGYFWFNSSPYTMHHGNSTKTINIFDAVRKLPAAKELMKKEIDYNNEFLNFNTNTNVVTVNQKYLSITDEVSNVIDVFLRNKNGLLGIRSPMGTGKSTVINHIIEECHHQDMKVLIITNRISVARDFGKKYNIKLYNTDNYTIGDSLVCQYDSLWRFNIKFFDIVIMDEFISLMLHSRSNLNNSSINIAKFFGSFNKKMVIADAFLTGYENFLLSHKETNLHLIDNIYRDPTTLYNYNDFNAFVQSIIVHSEKHKLTVSSTSLSFINSLQMLLSNRGINVVTLTAETPESTKELIYGLFEKDNHDKWDVLIYSPTLTVGVSNLNEVNYHFHYDSSMSTDAISSIQMIKRTRKTKEIHMFIKEKINYLKTSYNEIRDEYMGNIGRNIEQNYLFDIDDYGEAKLSSIGKKAIKIDTFRNILEFSHRDSMLWLLQYHFMHEPRIVDTKFSANVLAKYQKRIKDNKQEILLNNVEQFLKLNDMERTTLLLDSDADKTMQILAEIDDCIKDCSSQIKADILQHSLKDREFIQKCRYYKFLHHFTTGLFDDTDIKHKVSQSVIANNSKDLHFFNLLLTLADEKIHDEYYPSAVNKDKQLKYILSMCGYGTTKIDSPEVIGQRLFKIDNKIKQYFLYIKD